MEYASERIIVGGSTYLEQYNDFSIQCFNSFDEYFAYASLAKFKAGANSPLAKFLNDEQAQVDMEIRQGQELWRFGMFNKHPRTYKEAMDRTDFVYKDEYDEIKKSVREDVLKALAKSSVAKAMESKLMFSEREMGAFIFERASMALIPEIFYYSRVHKKSFPQEQVISKGESGVIKYFYVTDNTEVFRTIKITHENGEEEYIEVDDDTDYAELSKRGILSVTSDVKKVYQYKQNQPRVRKAVKILVAYTYGGYTTSAFNDFYTGITAALITEFLEGLGYAVHIEVLIGGGQCQSCPKTMNTKSKFGRRFIGITAKSFDQQLELLKLLYWISDPSALFVKQLGVYNIFSYLYGDALNMNQSQWHGINKADLTNPLGTFYRMQDIKAGNPDLLYFQVHHIWKKEEIKAAILDIVLTCENINLEINKKAINRIAS